MFSIIIIIRDNVKISYECLHSVAQTDYKEFDIVVVNNGGGEEISELINKFGKELNRNGIDVKSIINKKNLGAPVARNQAITLASGDKLVFLDNDVFCEDDQWLAKLKTIMIRKNDIAGIGPKLLFPYKRNIIQCAGGGINSKGVVLLMGRGQVKNVERYNYVREVQFYPTACLCVRRDLVKRVGGFDEGYFPVQYEDVDLCYKIRRLGFKFYYCPEIELFHYENITSKYSQDSRFVYYVAKNGLQFKRRWLKTILEEQDRFNMDDEKVNWGDIH